MRNRRWKQILGLVLLVVAAALLQHYPGQPTSATPPSVSAVQPSDAPSVGERRATDFSPARDGQWLEVRGRVIKLLRDDLEGSRHQRFLIATGPEHTLLVAHNIDLAPRVPLAKGDTLNLYGRFEWNDKGGVLHWTHHDPGGRRGGWIEHRGERYQ